MSGAATIKRLQLHEAAIRVYGGAWIARLAAHRGVQQRNVQRWASGEREVPDEVLADIQALAAQVDDADAVVEIERAAMEAVDKGLDPALVAGILETVAANIRSKPMHLSRRYVEMYLKPEA
jgi:hypothetical protein